MTMCDDCEARLKRTLRYANELLAITDEMLLQCATVPYLMDPVDCMTAAELRKLAIKGRAIVEEALEERAWEKRDEKLKEENDLN